MYNEEVLLTKAGNGVAIPISHFIGLSAAEISTKYSGKLSWGESQFLAKKANEHDKQNKMLDSRVLSRVNPQLSSAIRLGIIQHYNSRSYDNLFGSRASEFVSPDSVASMFSPAAYLTVLYRESHELHFPSSAFHLNSRRPDLASLQLSQKNMDEEVSTLTLASEVLADHIARNLDITPDDLLETLATHRQTGQTPYHQPYEIIRQVILEKQPNLSVLSRNPDVVGENDTGSLLAILANISPELKEILIEEITEENAVELYEKNFHLDISELNSPRKIANYYDMTPCQLVEFIGRWEWLSEESAATPGPLYTDGKHTIFLEKIDGGFEIVKTSFLYYSITTEIHYFEIIPMKNNEFQLRFSFKKTHPDESVFTIMITTAPEPRHVEDFVPLANEHYIRTFPLTLEEISNPNIFGTAIKREAPGGGGRPLWTIGFFRIERFSGEGYMLRLNKIIRLCQATGLSPSQLETLVFSINPDGAINRDVMVRLFTAMFYKVRYGLMLDDALVLSGALISRQASAGQVSHFDHIFNSPPLGGTLFIPDGEPVLLPSGSGEGNFATAALIRGLGVNNGELLNLCRLIDSTVTDTITADIVTISHLWRLCLLAREHSLSVLEFSFLYRLSPCHGLSAATLTLSQWHSLTEFMYQTTLLMTDTKLSASELYLMCTQEFDETLTPEMNNLLLSLRPRLDGVVLEEQDSDSLSQLLSPFISAAMSLSSPAMGRYVLLWSEALQPDELSMAEFAELAALESLTPEQNTQVARYCHTLAQTAMRVQKLKLSEAEVAALVSSENQLIGGGASADPLKTLQSLHAFHQWLNRLGTRSSEILASIEQKMLTPRMLAIVMETELLIIEQSMACAEVTELGNWRDIYRVLQWKSVGEALNVMPITIRQLLNLQYVSLPKRSNDDNWQHWRQLAHNMEAGIEGRAAQELESLTAERYITVLSSWLRTYCQPVGTFIRNRDELYSYLLIDNQVSAQVRTSRLAEAISSLQLYINRALNRMEDGARTDVITRQFFLDWSLNCRYSSWSGVSMLAYYPENYIEPTLRIGQTRMMNELLENISQGKLSQDAVEDAFKTYLTRFETVADLTVINAYHNNVNSDSGTTWLLGRSKENMQEYHWRTVDMSQLQDGSLPANAWGEWTRIEMPLNAWREMVRPVVFRERLHVIWVEREETARTESDGQISTHERFTLKLAFRRHDGTWSVPWNYDVSTQIESIPANLSPLGLSAAGFGGEDTLLVFIYRIAESYNDFGESNNAVTGLAIHGNGTLRDISGSLLERYSLIKNTFDVMPAPTEKIIKKASYKFAIGYDIPRSMVLSQTSSSNSGLVISSAKTSNITFDSSSESLSLHFNEVSATIANDLEDPYGMVINAMNDSGVPGDEFIVGHGMRIVTNAWGIYGPYIVFNKKNNQVGAAQESLWTPSLSPNPILRALRLSGNPRLLFQQAYPNLHDPLFSFPANDLTIQSFKEINTTEYSHSNPNGSGMTTRGTVEYSGWRDIVTGINDHERVTLSFSYNDKTHIFSADKHVTNLPESSFHSMSYLFNPLSMDLSDAEFDMSALSLGISIKLLSENRGNVICEANGTLPIRRVDFTPNRILQLHSTDTGAQYMQLGVHRIRLNTLLGPQLVSLAATGIDAILSMNTQHLPEPQLGKGFYATFTLPAYNADVHGTNRNFRLNLKHVVDNNAHVIYSGQFQDQELTVKLFIPLDATPLHSNFVARVFLTTQLNTNDQAWHGPHFTEINGVIGIHASSITSMFNNVSILRDNTEPMDFNGACALSFWELFYYTPMMAFQRLLQEQNFSEATRWLNYVWNPAGYIVQGQLQSYLWNVRPLEEETSWNASPLESIDPDAVAQADPMHYKVATFMRMLDLMIARGDIAYRQLERDTLNEAKMWYVQALSLLGDEPDLTFTAQWSEPTLSAAADKTLQRNYQQMLARICQGEAQLPETRTANSLTGLFFPEFNAVLSDYWKTLRQRLFNLRHNLSIDGQPLSLSIYAVRADPSQLLSSMVLNAQESSHLPASTLTLWRFPVMLERARNTAEQLTQFGTSLLSLAEHQDADELNTLLMQQGMELVTQSIRLQERVMDEVAADREVIEENRRGAQTRLATYQRLWEEGISRQEQTVMDMQTSASSTSLGAQGFVIGASIADMAPNIFGFAVGGSRWGGPLQAAAEGISIATNATLIAAERMGQSESYRRRREEWEIQRDTAESEIRQFDAQLAALDIRYEAAQLQVEYLQTQQAQTLAQMEFLQRKFTNQALYSWMRGKLSAIYYQFFDLSQSLCLMAQESLRRELNDAAATYIRGGAWNGASAGFMAGETFLLNLTEMEKVWLERDSRALEVTRTVSLAQVYRGLSTNSFELKEKLAEMLNSGSGSSGITGTELKFSGNGQLQASVQLAKLDISNDYPAGLGQYRHIKQVSVTLPTLVGPYEDVRAVLNYGGSLAMPKGCNAIAVSHGVNDSGQFVLDFNDARYLPFEGIPVHDGGSLTLSFPDATNRQKALLQTLNDIILHIRYTIHS